MELKNIEMTLNGRIGNMIYEIFSIYYFCQKYNIPTDIIKFNKNYILTDVIKKQIKLSGNDNYLNRNMKFFSNIEEKFFSEDEINSIFFNSSEPFYPYNICINLKSPNIENFLDKNIDYIKNCTNIKFVKYYDDQLTAYSNITSKIYNNLLLYKKLFYNKELFDSVYNNNEILKNRQRKLYGLSFRIQEFAHKKISDTIKEINYCVKDESDCYIFSDDIQTLKFNLDTSTLNFKNIYFYNENEEAYMNLITLAMCDKVIGNQPMSSFISNAKILNYIIYNEI